VVLEIGPNRAVYLPKKGQKSLSSEKVSTIPKEKIVSSGVCPTDRASDKILRAVGT
jgi:hypothetical protein